MKRWIRWTAGFAALFLGGSVAMGVFRAERGRERSATMHFAGAAESRPTAILSVEAAAFANGRWHLADPRSHQVHVLDYAGRPIRTIGRLGRGPGEFTAPSIVAASATRIFVAELGRRDISVFDSAGNFLRFLRSKGSCAMGSVAALGAVGPDLYVLRRCMELPKLIRLQLERSLDDGPLALWPVVSDTTVIGDGKPLPLHVPLMAVSANRLIMGGGTDACLHVVALPDGRLLPRRCINELSRRALPAIERQHLEQSWRGRVAVPDSLPRVLGIALLDSTLAVQIPETMETASWLELPWNARPFERIRQLGQGPLEKSFVGQMTQLIIIDDIEGVRVQVVPFER